MKYKVFEANNLQTAIDQCHKEGYSVANFKQTYDYRIKNKDERWLDTATIIIRGVIRNAKKSELKDMKKFVEDGGQWLICKRSWVASSIDYFSFTNGNNLLYIYFGRLVGVKK